MAMRKESKTLKGQPSAGNQSTSLSKASPTSQNDPKVPYRQIRALYNTDTITVYQAYSAAIALPAVKHQKLCASPDFQFGRMTWIKPSWSWMMYRAGYSFKDARQAHILAIKMKRTHFEQLLSQANVPHQASGPMDESESAKPVRVQWDPERSALLEKLDYRSIQIGISRRLSQKWATEWIEAIEDVTGMARALKHAIDEDPSIGLEELLERGLVPREEVYEVDEKLRKILAMDL